MSLLPFLDIFSKVIDKVIPDPAQKAQLQLDLAKLADQEAQRDHEEAMGQIEVNKVEATSPNMFVAGWRPFIGWVGGGAMAYNVVMAPMFNLGTADTSFLQTILLAILGMGAMRSYDKMKGTDTAVQTKEAGQPANPLAQSSRRKKFLGIF